jgi:N-acetylglutamate synthase/N-acetylornithine aminotransferase
VVGCVNPVTGKKQLEDVWAMARETHALSEWGDNRKIEALVMSTGVIRQTLPITKQRYPLPVPSTNSKSSRVRLRRMGTSGRGARMIYPDMGPMVSTAVLSAPGLHATILRCILTAADSLFSP